MAFLNHALGSLPLDEVETWITKWLIYLCVFMADIRLWDIAAR